MRRFALILSIGLGAAACSFLFQYDDDLTGETSAPVPCTAANAAVECNDNNPCTIDMCDVDAGLCTRDDVQGEAPGCGGDRTCDGQGQCVGSAGTECGGPSECPDLLQCVDGYCCSSACTDTCQACDVAGMEGTCAPLDDTNTPDGECGAGQVCNGLGQCLKRDAQTCTASTECASGVCADGRCCDRPCGTCEACDISTSLGSCAPLPALDPDPGCPPAELCDGRGACKSPDGASCSNSATCLSAKCIDDYCCADDCIGPCRGCDVAGQLGGCASHPAGTDPDGDCGGAMCNGNGMCN